MWSAVSNGGRRCAFPPYAAPINLQARHFPFAVIRAPRKARNSKVLLKDSDGVSCSCSLYPILMQIVKRRKTTIM